MEFLKAPWSPVFIIIFINDSQNSIKYRNLAQDANDTTLIMSKNIWEQKFWKIWKIAVFNISKNKI